MLKKKSKLSIIMLSVALLFTILSTSVLATGWSTDLKRWSGDGEIDTERKTTTTSSYYMKVNNVGSHYDEVRHWLESTSGDNLSERRITDEGSSDSPYTWASRYQDVVLNVDNPSFTTVQVEASGSWSPK